MSLEEAPPYEDKHNEPETSYGAILYYHALLA